MSRWLVLIGAAVTCVLSALPAHQTAADDAVRITSRVFYDVRLDQGPVRVSWEVTFQNNDPQTTNSADGEAVFFYENLTIPVLRGASALSATSAAGVPLAVTLSEPGSSPTLTATVAFDEPVFFGETYGFTLAYELAGVREPSLLVSPTYAYLPIIGGGDESTVTVASPSGDGWSVSLEPEECTQNGTTFTCSGADDAFLAALLEVSRPDAITSFAFEVPLRTKTVSVTLSYFQGESVVAQHWKDLVTAGLPVMDDLYGFPFPGSGEVSVAQGGREAVLGYEGLASCEPDGDCSVVVSPAADDITLLHELAHLWSSVYAERWLSEAFAQFIAEEAANRVPAGLVQSRPPEREPAAVNLRLDEWGDVSSLIAAPQAETDLENAGYYLSLRFLHTLRSRLGDDVIKRANAAAAAGPAPADSRRYLDLLEELSGQTADDLFAEWVFPTSERQTLAVRREARERLRALLQRVAEEGLSEDVANDIREHVDGWRFGLALAALDDADAKLLEYEELKGDISRLTADAGALGLTLPASVSEGVQLWQFSSARQTLSEARTALRAFAEARARVDTRRSLWQRFGLLGIDAGNDLDRASEAFAGGEFDSATEHANAAAKTIDEASDRAFRRLFLFALVLLIFAGGIGVAIWLPRGRDRDFGGL